MLLRIGEVLDRSIEGVDIDHAGPPALDLSRIDFKALAARFEASTTKNLELTGSLTDEETRHAREQLTEEELVVFDLLTRPGPDLTAEERDEVKKVTRQLLAKLRAIFTVDWSKTAQSRARVQDAIEQALDDGLPRAYTPEVFTAKAGVVFQHVYEQYGRAA